MQWINIGLSDEQQQGMIGLLNQDWADFYPLLMKTKKYHWEGMTSVGTLIVLRMSSTTTPLLLFRSKTGSPAKVIVLD